MKIYEYKKNDYQTMFDNAQNVFFEYVNGFILKYIFGLCGYDKNKKIIRKIEYVLDDIYNVIDCKITEINVSDLDENKYIGKKYFKLYGTYEGIEKDLDHIDLITNNIYKEKNYRLVLDKLFDDMLKSNIIVEYCKEKYHYKDKLNDKILSKIPFPETFTQETVNETLKYVQNALTERKLKKYKYNCWKDPKFWIPTGISIFNFLYIIIRDLYIDKI